MKVLVTGATGSVGSPLDLHLLEQRHGVRALLRREVEATVADDSGGGVVQILKIKDELGFSPI